MHEAHADFAAGGALAAGAGLVEAAGAPRFTYDVECRGPDGQIKWREVVHNLVTTAGKNLLGEVMFRAQAKSAGWYVGLKGSGSAAAGDTMASHAGWAEVAAYSEAARPALTLAAFAGGSSSNTASKAAFSINGSATVAGAFTVDNSGKGGTTGTLYSAGDFAAARAVQSGDSLSVTITLSF